MLAIAESKIETGVTDNLRRIKPRNMRSRYQPADLNGAVISAAKNAAKYEMSYFVYAGNSYGHGCYRVTYKRNDALCPINNTGGQVFEITPDLTVTRHKLAR